jgi:hypothetical protein
MQGLRNTKCAGSDDKCAGSDDKCAGRRVWLYNTKKPLRENRPLHHHQQQQLNG